jgi:hypothetical protein
MTTTTSLADDFQVHLTLLVAVRRLPAAHRTAGTVCALYSKTRADKQMHLACQTDVQTASSTDAEYAIPLRFLRSSAGMTVRFGVFGLAAVVAGVDQLLAAASTDVDSLLREFTSGPADSTIQVPLFDANMQVCDAYALLRITCSPPLSHHDVNGGAGLVVEERLARNAALLANGAPAATSTSTTTAGVAVAVAPAAKEELDATLLLGALASDEQLAQTDPLTGTQKRMCGLSRDLQQQNEQMGALIQRQEQQQEDMQLKYAVTVTNTADNAVFNYTTDADGGNGGNGNGNVALQHQDFGSQQLQPRPVPGDWYAATAAADEHGVAVNNAQYERARAAAHYGYSGETTVRLAGAEQLQQRFDVVDSDRDARFDVYSRRIERLARLQVRTRELRDRTGLTSDEIQAARTPMFEHTAYKGARAARRERALYAFSAATSTLSSSLSASMSSASSSSAPQSTWDAALVTPGPMAKRIRFMQSSVPGTDYLTPHTALGRWCECSLSRSFVFSFVLLFRWCECSCHVH